MPGIGYQLFSSREHGPLEETLGRVRAACISEVEGFEALWAERDGARRLRDALGAADLTMPSGHFSLDGLRSAPAAAIDVAEALGIKTIVVPYLPPEARPGDAAGWVRLGDELEGIAARLADAGLGTAWHNHDFELAVTEDGALPMEVLLNAAPSVGWEADLAWIVRAGDDPAVWLRRCSDRITHLHVKDVATPGEAADEDGWADVGQGVVGWSRLWSVIRTLPLRAIYLEHDRPKDDMRFLKRSLEYLNGIGARG